MYHLCISHKIHYGYNEIAWVCLLHGWCVYFALGFLTNEPIYLIKEALEIQCKANITFTGAEVESLRKTLV